MNCKGKLNFTVGTSFKCTWKGQELTGIVRVEGTAQADLYWSPQTRWEPEDFEVDNVEILDMSLSEFENLSFEVEDEDELYDALREGNVIDEDIEKEISTEYSFDAWEVPDADDIRADEEYDRRFEEAYDAMREEEMIAEGK